MSAALWSGKKSRITELPGDIPVLSVKHLNKTFDGVKVLDDIQFDLHESERLSVLGSGGSGKSTLFKMIVGLVPPDVDDPTAAVSLFGVDMLRSPDKIKHRALRKVGMAFQQGALFDYLTVEENIDFALRYLSDLDEAQRKSKIDDLLAGVKLGKTHHMFPHELSGGMQKRVGIARALATQPIFALFDEPTAGLDPVTSTIILNMIEEICARDPKTSAMICTTNVEIGLRFADRVIVMHEGRILADGSWRDLLLNGEAWVKKFLSTRLIGLDRGYAVELDLPPEFIKQHWASP